MPALLLSSAFIALLFANPSRAIWVRIGLVLLATSGLLAPLLVAPPGAIRTLLGYGMVLGVFRTIQMVREDHPVRFRLFCTVLVIDPRAQSKTDHDVLFLVLRTVGFAAGFVLCMLNVERAPLVLGTLFVALGATAFEGAARLVARAFGNRWGALHDDPWMARSLAEFWGGRWNRVVSHWLKSHAFEPVAERFGRTSGVVATFTVSALLHFYPTYISTNLRNGLMMASYFMIQGVLVLFEGAMPQRWGMRWKRPFAYVAILTPIPLFVFPVLRSLSLLAL